MTTGELADLVRQMRDAQKAYFRTRNTFDLAISKDIERRVDRAVAAVLAPPTLFDDMVISDQCTS